MRKIKIVCLAGGTGGYALTRALSANDTLDIVAVPPVSDEGGSSKRLLDAGHLTLPAGDAAQLLLAMSSPEQGWQDLLSHRLLSLGLNGGGEDADEKTKGLTGHSVINILIAASAQKEGNFKAGLRKMGERLSARGQVLPVSTSSGRVGIERANGQRVIGEHEIDSQKDKSLSPIVRVFMEPAPMLDPEVKRHILKADAIVIGPGSFFTSVAPILLTHGMAEALSQTRAKIIGVSNLANEAGHTTGWDAFTYASWFEKLIYPACLDALVVNSKIPPRRVLKRYEEEGEEIVPIGTKPTSARYKVVDGDLLSRLPPTKRKGDAVVRSVLRHDTYLLSAEIMKALRQLGIV